MSGDGVDGIGGDGVMGRTRNYIGGEYVSSSGDVFDDLSPSTGEVLSRVESADSATLDRAFVSALSGFEVWRDLSVAARGRVLRRTADLLRSRLDDLSRVETLDSGKPLSESLETDVHSASDALEFFGSAAATMRGDHYEFGESFGYVRREPLGVCVGLGAWNYPLQIAAWKSAPALACGNAMIFKPSELTPLSAVRLAEIFTEAGLPDGVFNVVHGDGSVGAALIDDPRTAKASLTGEASTGERVMAAAAKGLRHVTLEMGGKSPLLIFADADLDNAVSGALMANFYTQGEVCSNATRVFVERSAAEEFIRRVAERTSRIVVGDPMDPDTRMGALISKEHLEKVAGYIRRGVDEGARLVRGGERIFPGGCENGCFLAPAIFADCKDDMSIVREEIFGPVMCVLTFDDEDEAVRRANDTVYGLSAGVFTKDASRAHRVCRRLEAGVCWINTYNLTPVELPFGGVKRSGIGRENSLEALEHYSQRKTVYVETGNVDAPF